jgi:hypothetical protein
MDVDLAERAGDGSRGGAVSHLDVHQSRRVRAPGREHEAGPRLDAGPVRPLILWKITAHDVISLRDRALHGSSRIASAPKHCGPVIHDGITPAQSRLGSRTAA